MSKLKNIRLIKIARWNSKRNTAIIVTLLLLSVFAFIVPNVDALSGVQAQNSYLSGSSQGVTATENSSFGTSTNTTLSATPYLLAFNSTSINSGDMDEKVDVVNGQRYVLTNDWSGGLPGTVSVYSVNSNWGSPSLASTSPFASKDFYVPGNLCSEFPGSIIVCGRYLHSGTNSGYVAEYNITSSSWVIADQAGCVYITNIFPAGSYLLIQIALSSTVAFYYTTPANLLQPSLWIPVSYPSWSEGNTGNEQEWRLAYFDGLVYATQDDVCSNTPFGYTLGTYEIGVGWSKSVLMSSTSNVYANSGIYLFGYVWADSNFITFTCPTSNGYWNIYYSTSGTTFNLVTTLPACGKAGFTYSTDDEFHCFVTDFQGQGKFFLVSNEQDSCSNGYIALMDLNGFIVDKGGNYDSHDTEINNIYDGNYIVQGSEITQPNPSSYTAGVKIITVSSASKPVLLPL